jgi:hypothetical protein
MASPASAIRNTAARPHMALSINPPPAFGAGWRWQHLDLFIIADGLNVHASSARQLAFAKEFLELKAKFDAGRLRDEPRARELEHHAEIRRAAKACRAIEIAGVVGNQIL